jgi:hypothetical protein
MEGAGAGVGVEPQPLGFRAEYYRHSVVQGTHQLVGFDRQNGTGFDRFATRPEVFGLSVPTP